MIDALVYAAASGLGVCLAYRFGVADVPGYVRHVLAVKRLTREIANEPGEALRESRRLRWAMRLRWIRVLRKSRGCILTRGGQTWHSDGVWYWLEFPGSYFPTPEAAARAYLRQP